jgi:hypothetical protein
MIIILFGIVGILTLLLAVLNGYFWSIIRVSGGIIWPLDRLPLWLTARKLYIMSVVEISGLISLFVLGWYFRGFLTGAAMGVGLFIFKQFIVTIIIEKWKLKNP